MSRPAPRSSRGGFTLIELIVVTLIFAILMVAAATSMDYLVPKYKLRGAAREIGAIMKEARFIEHIANPEHAIFKRAGTQLALKGEKFSVEVALAESESGPFLQTRYDTFVLFDTGDLEKLADDLAAKLKA